MIAFVVDSDILINIQKSGYAEKVAALGRLPVVLTDVVWSELTIAPQLAGARPETVAQAEQLLAAMAGAPTVLQPQSPEAESFADLQQPPETEGIGEHSVIAYALHHPDGMAVLLDRRALYRGVEELRGRVVSFFGFLDLLRKHGLPPADASQIAKWYTARYKPAREPLWW